MKALGQLQELISSLQNLKGKLDLIVFSSFQSNKPQGSHPFKEDILTEIQSQVQNLIEFCKSQFLPQINEKLREYEEKSGEKLFLVKDSSLSQPHKNIITGEDFKHRKKELRSHSEENILGPILTPILREELNNSQEIGLKYNPFKGSESSRQYQQSHQSFYTAIQSQNLQDFKYKYLVKNNLETNSVRQDQIKILNEESSDKFQSMDERSQYRSPNKKIENQTKNIRNPFKIHKAHETKIVIKKKEKKTGNLKRSSSDIQEALLEIIYGKDLFPFIKFYLREMNKNRMFNTLQSSESQHSEQTILREVESQKIKEGDICYTTTEQKYNPLIKYLTKGTNVDDLTFDEVMEAKFQRLVIICFDTVLHTLKTMSYFMPLGELNEIVLEIQRDELNVFRSRCLGSQEKDIEKICKKVKKIMKGYRAQMKDENTRKHFFNKTLEIKTTVA